MNPYRSLPSVDSLLAHLSGAASDELPRVLFTSVIREVLSETRDDLSHGIAAPTLAELTKRVLTAVGELTRPSLRPAINATGVIIHTNLGRAPLSDNALAAMDDVGRGYSNLEFDLRTGERGSRFAHLDGLLRQLTGAESGIAVNNNASALLLTLAAVAFGREVIISRSQAVEIGGGFRIPDVMRQSGARLVEVGTTNRTYVRDFAEAITPETAAILRVHASNFRISGFTTFPPLRELSELALSKGILLIDDLGSGCLLPVEPFGLSHEPTVQESVEAGSDLSLFSGDKLLGGPQAGIIVGRAALVQQLRAHPLARAVRMDKASIAGLAATLLHYLRGEAVEKVPVWQMISAPLSELEARAGRWARAAGGTASTAPGRSVVGGGSLPEETLPTSTLVLRPHDPDEGSARLRALRPAVICRIEHDCLIFDPRTVNPRDDHQLLAALVAAGLTPSS